MEHNFNKIITKPCLSSDGSIIIGSAKDKFDKKVKENKKRLDFITESTIVNKEIILQSEKNAKQAIQLNIANKKLAFQIRDKADMASELIIANKKIAFQISEKADRAAELIIANKEKDKRAAKFVIACNELAFQIRQKSSRASELVIANKELAFQIGNNADMAAELIIANNKLIISNKELALQNKENAEWAAKLIIANKEQSEYFVNISHELKTPLNIIFATAQLFDMYCEGSLDKNKRSIIKYIDSTKQNCYRLSKLINNITDLSKIEAGCFKLKLSNNNIIEVVEKMVTSVTAFTERENLSIVFDTNVEEKNIVCDPEMIERVVLNLISNAIKFSNAGDEIFVQVKDRNDFIEISVKDNGIGIDEKNLDIIFDRFKQVDKSLSRNAEGSGIGLSLVKSIVELHGGNIHVESKVGKGSKFTIKIPSKNVCHENMLYESNMTSMSESAKVELSDVYYR